MQPMGHRRRSAPNPHRGQNKHKAAACLHVCMLHSLIDIVDIITSLVSVPPCLDDFNALQTATPSSQLNTRSPTEIQRWPRNQPTATPGISLPIPGSPSPIYSQEQESLVDAVPEQSGARGAAPTDKLATLSCESEAEPPKSRMSARSTRLKDEGTKLQVVSAGAIAGLVSRFIVAPLDVVKIRLQLQPYSLSDPLAPLRTAPAYHGAAATLKHILRHEGLTGLWKGNVPAELLYVCYASIQFTTYRTTTLFLQTALPTRLPDAAESFIAGASSGALATSITYPLDLLRTRFAAQGHRRIYSSLRSAVWVIKRDEGYRGFFRGINPALGQIVPFMGIFFVTYEGLRAQLSGFNMPWGGEDATAGMVGSVVAKTTVFPLDLVRKRIQVQGPTRARYVYGDIPEYTSALRGIAAIARTEGLRGLYKGLPISLVKSAPASAVTVWTYERSLNFLMNLDASREAQL